MSTILIVDDEPAFRAVAGDWFTRRGHTVLEAGDAAQARTVFAQTPCDLVLLDLVMPPERTPEAGLSLLPLLARVPVVVLTAHAEQALALRAVEAGAWDFLAKPVDPDLLRVVVDRALTKRALDEEVARLRQAAPAGGGSVSPAMRQVETVLARIAPTDLPVILQGPSGAGKEVAARGLHAASPRAAKPFVPVHCGAIPAELIESELFGHLKGSFTGAHADRPGLLASADGGTLFLDEVGEMPPAFQVKLLRVLQDGMVTPVGGRSARRVDVRVVCATNRDLAALVASGGFREDLYYRLRGLVVTLPGLDQRREDIAPLAAAALRAAAPEASFTPQALAWLAAASWPGNLRELLAVVRAAAVLAQPGADGRRRLTPEDLAFARGGPAPPALPVSEGTSLAEARTALERQMIGEALSATGGNHSAAARRLGLSRVGLLKMLDRLGLR